MPSPQESKNPVRASVQERYNAVLHHLEGLKSDKHYTDRHTAELTKHIAQATEEVDKLADWLRNNP